MKATTTSGVFALMEHSLEVNPGNVKNHNFETGASIYDVPVAIDLDEDGKTEVYVNDGINNKFYEGDDNARYSTIKKIWNSNLPSGNKVVADINRDGKVDMVCYGNQQPYSLVNEGNKQMIFTELPVTGYYDGEWRDFNNDGLLEPLYYKKYVRLCNVYGRMLEILITSISAVAWIRRVMSVYSSTMTVTDLLIL